jgi:hypothetical protein
MAAGPSHSFVALVLVACAAGAVCRALQPAPEGSPIELQYQELVRVHGGQLVLVLREKSGARRLPVPISKAEAALIERGLHGKPGLATQTVEALGGRVLRASIDEVSRERGFRGHLALGAGTREVSVEGSAGEALSLALQAGAQIVADPAVLDERGVAPEDLQRRAARDLTTDPTPAPVLPN